MLTGSGEGLVEDPTGLGHTLVAERARGVVEPPLIVVAGLEQGELSCHETSMRRGVTFPVGTLVTP